MMKRMEGIILFEDEMFDNCRKCDKNIFDINQKYDSENRLHDAFYEKTGYNFYTTEHWNVCSKCDVQYCVYCSKDNNISFKNCINCGRMMCDDCLIYKTSRVCESCYSTFEICFKCLGKYHPDDLHNCNADEGTYIKLLPNELKYIISNFAD